jgi:hypothetical protein
LYSHRRSRQEAVVKLHLNAIRTAVFASAVFCILLQLGDGDDIVGDDVVIGVDMESAAADRMAVVVFCDLMIRGHRTAKIIRVAGVHADVIPADNCVLVIRINPSLRGPDDLIVLDLVTGSRIVLVLSDINGLSLKMTSGALIGLSRLVDRCHVVMNCVVHDFCARRKVRRVKELGACVLKGSGNVVNVRRGTERTLPEAKYRTEGSGVRRLDNGSTVNLQTSVGASAWAAIAGIGRRPAVMRFYCRSGSRTASSAVCDGMAVQVQGDPVRIDTKTGSGARDIVR